MPFSGDPTALTETGGINKTTFRAQFITPVVSDLEALQGGSAVSFSGLSADGALASTTRFLSRSGSTTAYATLADMAMLVPGITGNFITGPVLGMAGDGVIDDAPALQRGFNTYAGTGAVFLLKSVHANNRFLLRGRVRQPGGISVVCASPFLLQADGGYDIRGERAYLANRDDFRLLSAASASATSLSVDTSVYGGGAVSTFFAVGDQLELQGQLDSAATPLIGQREIVHVTSVSDPSTLGVTATTYAYSVTYASGEYQTAWGLVNRTKIKKVSQARLSATAEEGVNLVSINSNDAGRITTGDDVILEDDKIASDVRGSATGRLHREPARITASVSGDASNTLRLGHRTEHQASSSYRGRLTKVSPARNASLTGATFLFGEAPALSPAPIQYPFRMILATECSVSDCSIPNTDSFGSRGGFRFELARGCSGGNLTVRDPKYTGTDEGVGVSIAYSKGVNLEAGFYDGVRHGVQFVGSTGCLARSPVIANTLAAGFHFAGLEEVGCIVFDAQGTGGVHSLVADGRNPPVVAIGSATNLNSVEACGLVGGRFQGYRAEDDINHEPCIRFFPGAVGCFLDGTEFDDIGTLLYHADVADFGTLVAINNSLIDLRIFGCRSWLVNADGRANGAGVDTLSGLLVDGLRGIGAHRGFNLARCATVTIRNCALADPTTTAAAPYVLQADAVTDLNVEDNRFDGWLRGISLSSCGNSWSVLENDFGELEEFVILRDAGGNDGGLWHTNVATGTATADLRSLRAGGSAFKEFPRLAGPVSLVDDALLTLAPPRGVGMAYFNTLEDVVLFSRIIYFAVAPSGTPGIQYSDDTGNVAYTTGDITAGGTDGSFNVSVYNGNIQLRNRLGSTIVLDFAYL